MELLPSTLAWRLKRQGPALAKTCSMWLVGADVDKDIRSACSFLCSATMPGLAPKSQSQAELPSREPGSRVSLPLRGWSSDSSSSMLPPSMSMVGSTKSAPDMVYDVFAPDQSSPGAKKFKMWMWCSLTCTYALFSLSPSLSLTHSLSLSLSLSLYLSLSRTVTTKACVCVCDHDTRTRLSK
jgi:hypothetical protein